MTERQPVWNDVTRCPVCQEAVHLDQAWHDRRRGVGTLVHYDCLTKERKKEVEKGRERLTKR